MGCCLKSENATEPTKKTNLELNRMTSQLKGPKLTDVYSLKKVIGQGAFGIVRKGARIDNPKLKTIINIIDY